jgi:hypothetical protein
MHFYLGTHEPSWLKRTSVPFFISRRRLARLLEWPEAVGSWALDSGGFSELSIYGEWRTTVRQYIWEVWWAQQYVGGLEWAAQQDWMCEPFIVEKTGLSVLIHQQKTIDNYLELMETAPTLPWIPVLQGFILEEYLRHVDMYAKAGVNLSKLALVGIGSICRRQHTEEAAAIIRAIAGLGIRLHGFGLKEQALKRVAGVVHSADSMAWSFVARRRKIRLKDCHHKTCQNCLYYALSWRKQLLQRIGQ